MQAIMMMSSTIGLTSQLVQLSDVRRITIHVIESDQHQQIQTLCSIIF